MQATKLILLSALVAAFTTTTSAQNRANHAAHLRYDLHGDAALDQFGATIAFAGDVNKDGCDDLIVGARYDDNNGANSGMARVFSGVDGRVLYSFDGDFTNDLFGWSVAGAGDVNRDGYADVVVGAHFADNVATNGGMARVFSGKDGKVLWTFNGTQANEQHGYSVYGAGDTNLDGHADIIVGSPFWDSNTTTLSVGRAILYSGKDGKILKTITGSAANDLMGHSVCGGFDANKDAFKDYAASAVGAGTVSVFSGVNGNSLKVLSGATLDNFGHWLADGGDVNNDGYGDLIVSGYLGSKAFAYSGKDWTVIWTVSGTLGERQGWTVGGGSDVDKDGFDDIVTGPGAGAAPGRALVFSGKTGKQILELNGYQVAMGGDTDGDGYDDILTSTWLLNGIAWIYSGKALTMRTDEHQISATSGGTQNITLACGSAYANQNYWIFGSATGPKPGITLTGVKIPLNPDAYTDLCYALVGANPPYDKFRGKLDSSGNATASLIVPSNLSFAVSLYHAAVVYDNSGKILFATNASSVRVQ